MIDNLTSFLTDVANIDNSKATEYSRQLFKINITTPKRLVSSILKYVQSLELQEQISSQVSSQVSSHIQQPYNDHMIQNDISQLQSQLRKLSTSTQLSTELLVHLRNNNIDGINFLLNQNSSDGTLKLKVND